MTVDRFVGARLPKGTTCTHSFCPFVLSSLRIRLRISAASTRSACRKTDHGPLLFLRANGERARRVTGDENSNSSTHLERKRSVFARISRLPRHGFARESPSRFRTPSYEQIRAYEENAPSRISSPSRHPASNLSETMRIRSSCETGPPHTGTLWSTLLGRVLERNLRPWSKIFDRFRCLRSFALARSGAPMHFFPFSFASASQVLRNRVEILQHFTVRLGEMAVEVGKSGRERGESWRESFVEARPGGTRREEGKRAKEC